MTIKHCVEQGDPMLFEGVEMLYDRANQQLIRDPSTLAVECRGDRDAKMRDCCDGSVVTAPGCKLAAGS
jgi:hypothetical protein